jgi:NADH:ubiquinone oxidoreductase subunit E
MTNALKTKEFKQNLARLRRTIDAKPLLADPQGELMGVLHGVQEIFGYIPREAMDVVAEKLKVPTAHVYGMATFYNYFTLKPKARHPIFVCKGTACYVGGGARILNKLKSELKIDEGGVTPDGEFSLDITRCLGCCGLSPVVQIAGDVHVRMVPEKIPALLAAYRGSKSKTALKVQGKNGKAAKSRSPKSKARA